MATKLMGAAKGPRPARTREWPQGSTGATGRHGRGGSELSATEERHHAHPGRVHRRVRRHAWGVASPRTRGWPRGRSHGRAPRGSTRDASPGGVAPLEWVGPWHWDPPVPGQGSEGPDHRIAPPPRRDALALHGKIGRAHV